MGINFWGYDLLLEDRAGKIQQWLDDWLPTDDLRIVSEWPAAVENSPLGLTQPNWSGPLRPKINTWYSPTGCSRWAYGLFLADQKTKAAIVAKAGSGTLTLVDDQNKLGRAMIGYLLPPRPISSDVFDPNGLWLLPIVDQRYYWQFATFAGVGGVTTQSPFTTWATAVLDLGENGSGGFGPGGMGAFGFPTTLPTIASAYLYPNQWDLTRLGGQNSAVVADVALASIGMRLVPKDQTLYGGAYPSGSGSHFAIHDFTLANGVRNLGFASTESIGILQSGILTAAQVGDATVVPAGVTVAFRPYKDGLIIPDELQNRFTISVTPTDVGIPSTVPTNPSYIKTIRSTALANYTAAGAFGGNPDNYATLRALAVQIATDFYGWLGWVQDSCNLGNSRALHTGFDDFREFSVGRRRADGSGEFRTRIQTMPHNFACDDLLHWDNTPTDWTFDDTLTGHHVYTSPTWEYGNVLIGVLDGPLAPNGTQTISITGGDRFIPTGGTYHVLVNEVNGMLVSTGQKVTAIRDGLKWAVVDASGSTEMLGSSSTTVTAGNSGTFTLTSGLTVTALVRYGVALANKTYLITPTDAFAYEVVNPDRQIRAQCTSLTVGPASATFTVYAGTLGSETTQTVSVTGYFRRGVIFANKTYLLDAMADGFEVANPSLEVRGQCTTDTATDANSGTFTIFTGTGNGTTTGVTISSVFNSSSCTILANKTGAAYWIEDTATWAFFNGHT